MRLNSPVTTIEFWRALHNGLIIPLKQLIKASQVMAGGDLTQELDPIAQVKSRSYRGRCASSTSICALLWQKLPIGN